MYLLGRWNDKLGSYAILRLGVLFGKKTGLMAYPGLAGLNLCPFRSSISIGFTYDDLSTG